MTGPIDYASMMKQLMSGLQSNVAYDPITNKNKGLNPLAGTEGARPNYPGGGSAVPMAKPQLVVARKLPNGTVEYGQPGQIHADLPSMASGYRGVPSNDPNMGFALPGGRFLSREQALKSLDKADAAALKHPNKPLLAEDYVRRMSKR
jgi:hypothetical protein